MNKPQKWLPLGGAQTTLHETRRKEPLKGEYPTMASLFASAKGNGLRNASSMASSCAVILPGFLIPAWQTHATRQRKFSTTTPQLSKLGRTPLSIPPDVEVTMSEPIITRNMTSYLPDIKKTITVKGPLGMCFWLPSLFGAAAVTSLHDYDCGSGGFGILF